MRYAIRRMRRKLPDAIMMLGCWTDLDARHLQEAVKADEAVNTLNVGLAYAIRAATGRSGPLDAGAGIEARIDQCEKEHCMTTAGQPLPLRPLAGLDQGHSLDRFTDETAPLEEQQKRKRKLIDGPANSATCGRISIVWARIRLGPKAKR